MFLEQQNSILKLFLKDHVTLKTGVMASKKQALSSRKKNDINKMNKYNKINLTKKSYWPWIFEQ